MSSESQPITPERFAEAIKDLPLSALHAKASEIRNSIAHLRRSNEELQTFITESCESETDKRELESYVAENEGVIAAMKERVQLLKDEVEWRGQRWVEEDEKSASEDSNASEHVPTVNGTSDVDAAQVDQPEATDAASDASADREEEGCFL